MDWTRARLILVAAFTVVNIVLAALLWAPGNSGDKAMAQLAPFQMREMRVRLAEQGIDVEPQVPSGQPALSLLRLAPPDPQTREEIIVLFNRMASEPMISQGTQISYGPLETENGTLLMRLVPPIPADRVRDTDEQLRRVAGQFLTERGLSRLGTLRQSRVYAYAPGQRAVEFVPVHKNVPVFSGHITLVMGPGGWEEVLVFLPAVIEERGEPKSVLAAPEALLRLAAHLRAAAGVLPPAAPALNPRVVIRQVELGYYASLPNRARAWDTVPTWRILTGDGEVYHVNAFTGDLEQS